MYCIDCTLSGSTSVSVIFYPFSGSMTVLADQDLTLRLKVGFAFNFQAARLETTVPVITPVCIWPVCLDVEIFGVGAMRVPPRGATSCHGRSVAGGATRRCADSPLCLLNPPPPSPPLAVPRNPHRRSDRD